MGDMTYALAPETQRLADTVREWSVAELRPLARQAELEHSVPEAARQAMATAPFTGDLTSGVFELLDASPDPSLHDARYVTATSVVESGVYGDALFLAVTESGIGGKVVDLLGTPGQVQRWRSDSAIKAYGATGFALTEPGSGSDAGGLRTTATRVEGGWLLNGSKIFCSHGAVAGYIIVFATVDRAQGNKGVRAFVVERGTLGLHITKANESKLGVRAMQTTAFSLDNCLVHDENLLGTEENGPDTFRSGLATLNTTRHQVASMSVGIGQASLDEARPLLLGPGSGYSARRRDAIEAELNQFDAELHRARLLARRAAWLLDAGRSFAIEASTAKATAAPLAERVCVRMLQLLGPDGYGTEHLFEKRYRDIKIMDIWEGTGQIHRKIVGDQVLRDSA
jgi:acyl-CoA dehydrogenase